MTAPDVYAATLATLDGEMMPSGRNVQFSSKDDFVIVPLSLFRAIVDTARTSENTTATAPGGENVAVLIPREDAEEFAVNTHFVRSPIYNRLVEACRTSLLPHAAAAPSFEEMVERLAQHLCKSHCPDQDWDDAKRNEPGMADAFRHNAKCYLRAAGVGGTP